MRWNVGNKIAAGFGATVAIFLLVGASALKTIDVLVDAADQRKQSYQLIGALGDVMSLLKDVETGQRGYVITGNNAYLEPYESGRREIGPRLAQIDHIIGSNPVQRQRLEALRTAVATRLQLAAQTVETRRTEGFAAAVAIINTGRGKAAMDGVRVLLAELRTDEERVRNEHAEDVARSAQMARWTIGLGTAAACALALLAGVTLARGIARPLRELTGAAERITAGDLSARVVTDTRSDEVGVLSRAFARMAESLRAMAGAAEAIASGDLRITIRPQSASDQLGIAFQKMVGQLSEQMGQLVESASFLASSSSQIVASTSQLAANASQTAAGVSQTTTTVEEVRQTAQLASDKARLVSESSQKAAASSQSGRRATEDVSAGMARIREQMHAIAASMAHLAEQGQAIGQIIASVEDLAAQSKLLAVNAAIEAAKAGEHGRGFGVVAQEVKSLAEQSRQATTQVRTLLGEIQKATGAAVMATEQGGKAVEAGTRQTEAAGEAIQALAASVRDAAQSAVQIAASSQQQMVGIEQVSGAMHSIKEATAQNVSAAHQIETAARSLHDLGQRLQQIVARYRTGAVA